MPAVPSARQLYCLLPLLKPEELLWRKAIRYLLRFLGERYQLGNELATLRHLFSRVLRAPGQVEESNKLEFSRSCPNEESAFVLLDRHHLPASWLQTLQVIAIWDHRPDTEPDFVAGRLALCAARNLLCGFAVGLRRPARCIFPD